MAAMDTIKTGEISGSKTATQLPTVPCNLVKIKAMAGNSGKMYIGGAGVTAPDGTTDTTTGFELSAGEETGWLPVSNLADFYFIGQYDSDKLTYLALL